MRGEAVISAENSRVTVRVIPPAEDLIIVNHVVRLLNNQGRMSRSETRRSCRLRRIARLFYTKEFASELSFMHSVAAPVDLKRLPSPALRRFAWAVLAYFIAVILWGALVRATGSGAGCGDHWPLCNGTVLQHSPRVDTMIEFTHRITSGLSFFSAVGLLVWTLCRNRARTSGARGGSRVGRIYAG